MIRLGLVKEDPKLRPWFRRRTLISLFSILSKGFYPLAHFSQRMVPELQNPLYWDYLMAREHRHVVEYSEGSIEQTDIQFVFRDIATLRNPPDHPPPSMEIVRHESGVDFPIGRPLLLLSLHVYSYQRYDDGERRNYDGNEVFRGLEPIHGNTILLLSTKRAGA